MNDISQVDLQGKSGTSPSGVGLPQTFNPSAAVASRRTARSAAPSAEQRDGYAGSVHDAYAESVESGRRPAILDQAASRSPLSDPGRPLPDNARVDTEQWRKNADEAFKARQAGDREKFLGLASPDGVWVGGLKDAPQTSTGMVHMTHDELSRDLRDGGPLREQGFSRPAEGRFVIAPDAQGRVQSILLD
jgi:hypothetical protein